MARIVAAGVCAMLAAAAMIPSGPARAETSKSFEVAATIQRGCLIEGPGAGAGAFGHLDFGTVSAFTSGMRSASVTSNQTITLRCTPETNLYMSVDAGTHLAGGVRNLQRGADVANRIGYTLYSNAGYTDVIAPGASIGITVDATNYTDIRLPIFGRLTLSGLRPAGVYGDILTVTLSW